MLGARGMLGAEVAAVMSEQPGVAVIAPSREDFDAAHDDVAALLDEARPDWVVNCIAILAALIDERDPSSVQRATEVNANFPAELARAASERGMRMIQAGTDGVFSGRAGPYAEDAPADAVDVYGRTKSLGEIPAEGVLHMRSSLVGPESRGDPRSLAGRILRLDPGARLTGWTDHRWNGVTARAWARACAGIVRAGELPPSPFHLVPADVLSGYELRRLLVAALGRDDVEVVPAEGPTPSDRTLATRHLDARERVWAGAGYDGPPSIGAMLREQFAAQ